jgi:amidase
MPVPRFLAGLYSRPEMQRFPEVDAKYTYSPDHESIGTVQPGELFEVESVEGYSGYFRSPADFTPQAFAEAEAHKWAVTGPISVAGAEAGGAVAVTIHAIEIVTPGVVTYGGYTAADPFEWWDDESACDVYPVHDGVLRFDDRTSLPTRPLIGCLAVVPEDGQAHAKLQGRYGGNLDCREIRAGATVILPIAHDGGGLYFGDCKALMGDGEIVGPPEVGALVTASAVPVARPGSLNWPRIETSTEMTTLVSGKPLEWCAREALRELLGWVTEEYDLPRPKAALLLAMVAHAGICQISNTDYTAFCTMPRKVLVPYARP